MCVGKDGWEFESEEALLTKQHKDHERKTFFVEALMNPAFHWFFTQGQDALLQELYLPGVSALLNGFEASLRVTLAQLEPDYEGVLELSPTQVLNNKLLRKAHRAGIPIQYLAFPGEEDFTAKLETRKNVRIVQLRHDVCHGNILAFIQTTEYERIQILTPECLRPIAAVLLGMAYQGGRSLAKFRDANGRRPNGYSLPDIPDNPLVDWLPT
jgi:hypothetical protein